ncbi:hypothetical protein VKT23_010011 [Stygiomarasmius scandens]|uniref:Myb/SANT-like domain-containing protein n=1 Tax=Marasmiellus scandens TaxID=2682957 RepID=A0ABR1JDF6_9AGAR
MARATQNETAPKVRNRKKPPKADGPAKWTDSDITRFLDYLTDNHSKAGNGGNFTATTFREAADYMALVEYSGGVKDADACRNKWSSLKKTCEIILDIKSMSGWTWSDETGASIGTENAALWNSYIKKNPSAKPFRNKGWKFFHTVNNLLPSKAKGTNVFRPSQGAQGLRSNADNASQLPASQPVPAPSLAPEHLVERAVDGALGSEENGDFNAGDTQEQDGSPPWDFEQMEHDLQQNEDGLQNNTSQSDDAAVTVTLQAQSSNSSISTVVNTPKRPAPPADPASSKKPRSSSSRSDLLAGLVGQVSGMNETFRALLTAPTPAPTPVPNTQLALPPGTPSRTRIARAIARAEKEELDISDSDLGKFIHVVSRDVSVADAYNQISRPGLRTQFVITTIQAAGSNTTASTNN